MKSLCRPFPLKEVMELSSSPRILIVDDELGPRESLRMILQWDYNVVAVDGGQAALETLDQENFDLVISDIRMPDISGIDLLAEIKRRVPETEVVMITAYASVETAAHALRFGAMDYLIKPFKADAVKETVEKGLERSRQKRNLQHKMEELELANRTLEEEIEQAYQNIQKHYLETVRSLVSAVDAKDAYTKGHQERVAMFSMLLGTELELSARDLGVLQQAAMLHDIGKIGIREQVLLKEGPLTTEEFEMIKKHPLIGSKILSPVESLKDVIQLVIHHHERYDGKGYPRGLAGEEIPLGARIIYVADAVDAMLSNRPYAAAKSTEEVRQELRRNKGTQFDPRVVDAALRIDLPSRRFQ